MTARTKVVVQVVVAAVVAILLVVGIVAATPVVQPVVKKWLNGGKAEDAAEAAGVEPSHELVRDAQNRPVRPYTMRLAPETVRGLQVRVAPVKKAGKLVLPAQIGTLGYDTDRLYAVRPRFQGEVIKIGEFTPNSKHLESFQKFLKHRPLSPGDPVKKGDVLAVLWSKELGDRKVALVSALLDLYVDQETLARQKEIFERGSLPEATYRASVSKVEKDLSAVYAAEAGLGIARLTPAEIEEIRQEARAIQKRLRGKPETPEQRKGRLAEEVQKWARVALVAPRDGVIVEKNTNLNDIVDPARDTPLFRVADLRTLLINVNFHEEYLPLLQSLMGGKDTAAMRWKVRLEAEPDFPVLDLPVLRIAPSLDPNQHTATVIGRIQNPVVVEGAVPKHLLVGQFVTATVEVPPAEGVVAIPTNALNEVAGQSLVLVQPDPGRPEYRLRRVLVVRRTKDVTEVRSQLTPEEKTASEAEARQGKRPVETLRPGELVVTHGVTEMTEAMEDLLSKARTES
jgi:cobalt-zinc-cadmium efflux system membrane fusion protein